MSSLSVSNAGKLLLGAALSVSLILPGRAAVHADEAPATVAAPIVAAPPSGTSQATVASRATAASQPTGSSREISASEYEEFLQDKLDIRLSESVTRGEFIADLAKALHLEPTDDEEVTFKDLTASSPYYDAAKALYQHGIITSDVVGASRPLRAVNAVQMALKAADLAELAATYPQEKAESAIAKLPINPIFLNEQGTRELAAAVDSGLVSDAYNAELRPGGQASTDFAATLIGKVLVFQGQYKHYLGYVGDSDIYVKLTDAYNASTIIQSEELQKVVDAALEQNLVTGYNLKDSRYEPNFVEANTLVYGHSDLKHALQLIALLRSEDIDAKVQFEPKTSAFVYLKEWGEPAVSDQLVVKQIANGNYIEYAKEYDIAFEFANAADKARFNDIVLTYAKKNEENQAGLIAGSWWQPLYYSLTELPGYKLITNNKIEAGRYYAQSFSLKEQSQSVVDGFKQVDPNVTVESYDFWTDVPFYNYLNGESL